MNFKAYIKYILKRPILLLSTFSKVVDVLYIKHKLKYVHPTEFTARKVDTGIDREEIWYEDRAGWLIDCIKSDGVEVAAKRFEALCNDKDLSKDPYSCTQRIVKAAYLYKLLEEKISYSIMERIADDAKIVCEFYEYRVFTTFFNNHLLNNYRALILYMSYFQADYPLPGIHTSLEKIERIIEKNINVLFEINGQPILSEGSVSYELDGLNILVDLSCCAWTTPLTNEWKRWLLENKKQILDKYLFEGIWIIPQIGDITPNWTEDTMFDFINGYYYPNSDSVYRNIWKKELMTICQ